MARTDFGPEVKASMEGNANTPAKPRVPGIPRNPGAEVTQQERDSSGNTGVPPRVGPGRGGMPGMARGMTPSPIPAGVPDAHHIAAAAGIAHAILANRGLK